MSVCFHVYPSWCTLLRSLVGWRQSLCTHPDISVAHRERAWLFVNVDLWLQCAPRPTLVHEHAFFTSFVHGMPGTFYILQRRQRVLCVSITTRDGGGSYYRPKSKRRQPCLNVHWQFLCGVDLGVPKARLWGSNTKKSLSSLSHSQIKWEFMSVSPHSCHRVASPTSSDPNLLTSPNLPRITHTTDCSLATPTTPTGGGGNGVTASLLPDQRLTDWVRLTIDSTHAWWGHGDVGDLSVLVILSSVDVDCG